MSDAASSDPIADGKPGSAPAEIPGASEIPENLEEPIEDIGQEYIQSLRRGETPDVASIVRTHPELSPWLEQHLQLMRWMHGLSSPCSLPSPAPDHDEGAPAVHLRCPHCHQSVLVSLQGPGQVTCEHCGSSFQVEGGPDVAWLASGLPGLAERFHITGLLGSGSFGVVYKAVDTELDRTVALKVPRAGHFRTPEEEIRFLREARSVARLRHPRIMQVYEIAEAGGVPCIVRECVEGRTLEKLLRETRFSIQRSARIVEQVADALAYAHGEGVVHRDMKPENIIIDSSGEAHVADFGLARREEGEVTITLDGQILGTPSYMSPEQAAGEQHRVDGRSDVYSLGVILYELLTGSRPFTGRRNMVLFQVLHEEPRSPRRLNDRIPRDLETICLKAMAKERARRYASGADLRDDLRRFLRGEAIQARPLGRIEKAWRWCRRNPAIAALTAAMAFLLVAIAVGSTVAAIVFQEQGEHAKSVAEKATLALEENRRQLVRNNVASGARIFDGGRYFNSLPYLAEALSHDGGEPERELPHRIRIASTMARCPRLIHSWFHRGEIWHVAFSPDGELALCVVDFLAPEEHLVPVYSLETGKPACPPLPHTARVGARFSPDGRHVLTWCVDGAIRIWDARSGRTLRQYQHEKCCNWAEYSPDGSLLLSVGMDGMARIWRSDTVELVTALRHEGPVDHGTFSPDGKRALTLSMGAVFVWSLESREILATIRNPDGEKIAHPVFRPDGKRIATGGWSKAARLWDAATGKLVGQPMMHGLGVTGVAFSPDGKRLATASWDRGRIWDAETGAPLTRAMEEQYDQVSAAFSPDGRYFATTSGHDRTTCVWDAHTGQLAFQPIQHYRIARCVAFHPSGHLLICGGSDGMVRVWDLSRAQHGICSIEHSDEARTMDVSADGRHIVTASKDKTAFVVEASTGTVIARLEHERGIHEAMFRPGTSQVLTTVNDGRIELWDFRTGNRLYAVEVAPAGEFHAALFDASGDFLVTSNQQGVLALRDAATGAARAEPLKLGVDTRVLAFTRDGRRLCAGSGDGSSRVMALPDWKIVWQRRTRCGGIAAVAWSGREDLLATGHGDGSAWIRDAASGKCVAQIGDAAHLVPEWGRKVPHSSQVSHVEFSPDDRYLLSASLDGDARVWNARTGEGASNWLHHGLILSADFSPDGRWIATASRSGTGRVWDWRTAEPIAPPFLHEADVKRIAFDPRAERVFTASLDGSVKGWSLSRDDRPAGDLVLLARILSGQCIQGGGVRLLAPPEIEKDTQYLRSKYPEEFSVSPSDVLDWHRSEVGLSERRSAWWSLVWHADRLLAGSSESLPPAERASLHGKRARAHAELGHFKPAARDYRDAFRQDPRDHEAGYLCVVLSLATGDEEEAKRACRGLLALSAKSDLYRVMRSAVRGCMLVPAGASDLEEVVRLARKARDRAPSADSLGALGAALYRAGKLDEATVVLNAARLYHPPGEPQVPSGNVQDQAFLAMAFHDAGLKGWAAGALERAESWTREAIDSGKTRSGADLTWDERLWLEALVKQARAHLGK